MSLDSIALMTLSINHDQISSPWYGRSVIFWLRGMSDSAQTKAFLL